MTHPATEVEPVDVVGTTIGDLGSGPVETGTKTMVRHARLSASAVHHQSRPHLVDLATASQIKVDPPDITTQPIGSSTLIDAWLAAR